MSNFKDFPLLLHMQLHHKVASCLLMLYFYVQWLAMNCEECHTLKPALDIILIAKKSISFLSIMDTEMLYTDKVNIRSRAMGVLGSET